MTRLTLDGFKNFFKYYKGSPSNPQQDEAIEVLWKAIPVSLLEESAEWVCKYREEPPAPKPVSGPITPELMNRFSGHPASSFDDQFCSDFNALLRVTGFDTDLTAFRMLLAQMAHESGNWIYMKECGSTAYFTAMYENRDDLGNTQYGDGARFSGCGPIQCTGRYNFQASYDYLVDKNGLNDPRFMTEGTPYVSEAYPFQVCIGWLINNRYLELCKGGDLLACTRRLNGGTNGLEDRQYWYDKAKSVITAKDLA